MLVRIVDIRIRTPLSSIVAEQVIDAIWSGAKRKYADETNLELLEAETWTPPKPKKKK